MSSLQIVKTPGTNQGATMPLETDRTVIGRNPDCGIVIPVTSVSREHAQILRKGGKFFIEDLQSRNHTYVNNTAISEVVQLKHNDKIRICDFLAVYLERIEAKTEDEDAHEPDGSTTTVEATLSHNSGLLLETQPADKLRGLMEINANLSRTLELDALLPKIVDSLFQLFKQADRAFIILTVPGESVQKMVPKVVKTRRPQDEANARFSKGIAKQCIDTAQAFLSDDASQDSRFQTSQSVVDFRIRSVMCAPLVNATEGKAFGIIQLDTQDRLKKFTKSDLELLCGVANMASISLENVRMMSDAVQQERIKRDLQLAHDVQMSCLPQSLPEVAGYAFHAFYRPAYMVGGDYYDFIPLPENRLVVALGDVAGKGMPAALLVTKLTSEARYHFLRDGDPAKAVAGLNDLLSPQCSRMDRFITLATGVLDTKEHVLTFANAGHPSPLLYRAATKTVTECVPRRTAGYALGIMEGQAYDSIQVKLEPGDAVVIYSDGVTDAEDVRGTQYSPSPPRIISTLQAVGSGNPKALIDGLMKAVDQHTSGAKQNDDITLVAVGRIA